MSRNAFPALERDYNALLDRLDRSRAEREAASRNDPPPQVFTARCGRRRTYLSEFSRSAYEAGYTGWPLMPLSAGPAMDGFHDAEEAEQARRAEQMERAQEEAQR
jgi:hypothetical protein